MTKAATEILAVAFIDGSDSWRWFLKLDSAGLYRWYLERETWTNLRATTREDAESRLRRFAAESLSGTLVIVDAE